MAKGRRRRKQKAMPSPKPVNRRRLTRRRFLTLSAAAAAGIAISVVAPRMLRKPEPGASITRPVPTTKKAISRKEVWRRLSQRRAKVLNPFVTENLSRFANTINKDAEKIFSRFKRFGKEQGGFISFNPKTGDFKMHEIEDLVNTELANAIKKAKKGDFSQAEMILAHLKEWSWNDEIMLSSGRPITMTPALMMENFLRYGTLFKQRADFERRGFKEAAKHASKRIRGLDWVFRAMHDRLIVGQYDGGTVLENYFQQDNLFDPNSEQRFFAHAHSHPAQVIERQAIYGGPISKTDLKHSMDYGPVVVFELGKDFNAVHLGVNGKVVFSKRFPLKK